MDTKSKTSKSPNERLSEKRAGAVAVSEATLEKRHEKGTMHARERVLNLLDPDSFIELDRYAVHHCKHFGLDTKKVVGDGVITGQGKIDGRPVYIFAHDATFLGGALGEVFARKVCKVMDLAKQAGCPVIGLNESGGARIQEGVASLAGYADIFYRNVNSSGVIPQISVIYGPCAGGAVYSPAVTDFTIMVDKNSYMFITALKSFAPSLVKTSPSMSWAEPEFTTRKAVLHNCLPKTKKNLSGWCASFFPIFRSTIWNRRPLWNPAMMQSLPT